MKNAIGTLFIGLLLHYGSADVSHLNKAGQNNYLPPGGQNLAIEQDYNGLDSNDNRGYLPPQNGHNNENQGYLPPYHQEQQQDYHNGQQNDNHQYDHNVQVSYKNNHELPLDQSHDHYDDHQDNPNDDHVKIDQQQLEPVFPSSFSMSKNNHVNQNEAPSRGEGYSISPGYHQDTSVHDQSNPVDSYSSHQNGYDYTPPVSRATSELYPNQVGQLNGPGNMYHQAHNNGVSSNQAYQSQSQSSHGSSAASGQNSGDLNQDYLPPNQPNHGNSGSQQGGFSQSAGSNGNYDHSVQSQEQNYNQVQNYNQEQNYNQQQYSGQSQQNKYNQGQSNQHHHSGHQESQQDYHSQNFMDNFIQQGLGVNDVDPPNPDAAISLVSHQGSEYDNEPQSRLTVRGHVNVPLPIPQVGYFFVPGVVSQVPNLNEAKQERLIPAINIPAIINSNGAHGQQQLQVPSQKLSTPEYTRSFAFQKTNNPTESKLSEFSIIPSVQTNAINMHTTVLQDLPLVSKQQNPNTAGLQDLPFLPQQQNLNQNSAELQDLPFLPKRQNQNQYTAGLQDLPFLPKQQNQNQYTAGLQERPFLSNQPNFSTQQQNQIQNSENLEDHSFVSQQQNQHRNSADLQDLPFFPKKQENLNQENNQFIPPEAHPNHGHQLQNIARSEVMKKENEKAHESDYLPPLNDHDLAYNRPQGNNHDHLQHQHQENNRNTHDDYLPPDNENGRPNYMNDQYESSQYRNPPPTRKGSPPPPVTTLAPKYSKPSAIQAYSPRMAFKVSTNTPYNTFTPSTYLPAANDQTGQDHSAIDRRLIQEAQKNVAKIKNDNTVFPLEELLNLGSNDIGMASLMEKLRGRVRTLQIINNHANTVKNIKVLETADEAGVKTIKILGHSDVDPMGDHKVIHIVSKGSNPEGIRQTVKIFSDHEEVSLPADNAYLPPTKSKDSYRRH